MGMKIDGTDTVSLETVNKKLEAFVEVVLGKLVDQQQEIKKMKQRINDLEDRVNG